MLIIIAMGADGCDVDGFMARRKRSTKAKYRFFSVNEGWKRGFTPKLTAWDVVSNALEHFQQESAVPAVLFFGEGYSIRATENEIANLRRRHPEIQVAIWHFFPNGDVRNTTLAARGGRGTQLALVEALRWERELSALHPGTYFGRQGVRFFSFRPESVRFRRLLNRCDIK